jgi:hypothetical protein
MGGTFALCVALFLNAGFYVAAYVIEAFFLAAVVALTFGGLCLGSFIYHLMKGHAKFARQTLPWAS